MRTSYWINVLINLTTTYNRHHISLSREKGQSGFLAKKKENSKSIPQAKIFKNILLKSRETPLNLKCNYNKTTVIMCVQRNVLGSPKNLAPPPWEYAFLNFWNLAPKTILYFKLPLFARGIVFHVFVSLFQSAAILIKTKLIYIYRYI